MTRRAIAFLSLGAAAAVFALAVAWAFLAPGALGGSTEYATVDGTSMSPMLSTGDLVVLRARSTYEVGDVVGYRSEQLGRLVVHRIVARDGDRYVLKGDANDFQDVDRPTAAAVVGELWVHAPYVGTVVGWLATPLHAALVAGALALLFLAGGIGNEARRRRLAAGGSAQTLEEARNGAQGAAWSWARMLAIAGGATLGLAVLLGIASFRQPPDRSAPLEGAYRERSTLTYAALVRPSAVYPDGAVTTGEPAFLRSLDRLPLSVTYELGSALPMRVAGTAALTAVLSDGDGWSREIRLAGPTRFSGGRTVSRGTLDLRKLATMTRAFERETGTTGTNYLVTVVNRVEIAGALAMKPFATAFVQEVPFRLDDYRLAPAPDPDGEVAFSQEGAGSVEVSKANRVGIRGVDLPVSTARILATVAGAFALLLLLAVWLTKLGSAGSSEPARIARRHGPRLVALAEHPGTTDGQTVDLQTFESLLRVADSQGQLVLHARSGTTDDYLVRDRDVTYRYRVDAAGADSASPVPSAGRRPFGRTAKPAEG